MADRFALIEHRLAWVTSLPGPAMRFLQEIETAIPTRVLALRIDQISPGTSV